MDRKHINYALVEDVRPPMYKAMKYWGKKPHNIWREFIECYCPEGGIVLDSFAGSGVAAFESLIAHRNAIAFDINPMTSFFIEVTTCNFHAQKFSKAARNIISEITSDPVYRQHYIKTLDDCGEVTVYNYIWKNNTVWKINAKNQKQRPVSIEPDQVDFQNCQEEINIPYWYPSDAFPNSPLIKEKFIQDIGGNDISNLWTRRNLYLLAYLFELIQRNA